MKHKEYLDSESDYMHVVFPDVPTIPKRYIEIPEGAEVLTKYNDEIIFWKENKYSFHTTNSARWDDADDGLCTLSEYKQRYNSTILWQRHPENQEPLDNVKWFEGDLKVSDSYNIGEDCDGDKKYNHYFKNVKHLDHIDVYRVLDLFEVVDPCIQHAIKKLLCAGMRGAKNQPQDIQEAIDSLIRYQDMRKEDKK